MITPIHKLKSPFPVRAPLNPKIVIFDERCRCGLARSKHHDTTVGWGHGEAILGPCRKFSWAAFLDGKGDVIDLAKVKQS